MTEREYRQDDRADEGYCPTCGEPLSSVSLTTAARGYCETHGWVWADWTSRIGRCDYCVGLIRPDEPRHVVNGHTYCTECFAQLNLSAASGRDDNEERTA